VAQIEGSGVSAKSIVRELVPPVLWRILSKIKGRIQGRLHPPVDPWQGREADAGLLGPDDRRFIETRLPELTGWLEVNAAYFAAYMLNAQHAANIKGPVLEIGVFAGKFLMLLHYLGRRHGNVTVGVDIFTHSRPEPILRYAEALFGTAAGLSLHEIDSADLTAEAALALLGHEKPRAISVDGDHTAAGVLRDLRLSAAIVAERGGRAETALCGSF
jgi:Methyltransferase domain